MTATEAITKIMRETDKDLASLQTQAVQALDNGFEDIEPELAAFVLEAVSQSFLSGLGYGLNFGITHPEDLVQVGKASDEVVDQAVREALSP